MMEFKDYILQQSQLILQIKQEVAKVIVGQKELIDKMLIAILTGGHILLEGVPGLAKTMSINTLAQTIDATFSRIQFTPDLLPADIIGTNIYNPQTQTFSVKTGPIFANIVIADEINRAPAKVQSALLEAMQENQVTIGTKTYKLPSPFFVMATQNPIEQEGTYQLSEAQSDRFIIKTIVNYPTIDEELLIIRNNSKEKPKLSKVAKLDDIQTLRQCVKMVYIDEKVEKYLLKIVFATRFPLQFGLTEIADYIDIGGSPRASIAINACVKAIALMGQRDFVIPEDVKVIASDVLRHRIGLTFEAIADNVKVDDIIGTIINKIEVP